MTNQSGDGERQTMTERTEDFCRCGHWRTDHGDDGCMVESTVEGERWHCPCAAFEPEDAEPVAEVVTPLDELARAEMAEGSYEGIPLTEGQSDGVRETNFGIGPGTTKQCEAMDADKWCCRKEDGHAGDHEFFGPGQSDGVRETSDLRIHQLERRIVELAVEFQGIVDKLIEGGIIREYRP